MTTTPRGIAVEPERVHQQRRAVGACRGRPPTVGRLVGDPFDVDPTKPRQSGTSAWSRDARSRTAVDDNESDAGVRDHAAQTRARPVSARRRRRVGRDRDRPRVRTLKNAATKSTDRGSRISTRAPGSRREREQASLTWARIDARSRAIGAVLASHSEPGARVLILLPPSVDFVPAFFGVLYAGAIAIPTYPPSAARADRSSTRLRGMIADAGVTLGTVVNGCSRARVSAPGARA